MATSKNSSAGRKVGSPLARLPNQRKQPATAISITPPNNHGHGLPNNPTCAQAKPVNVPRSRAGATIRRIYGQVKPVSKIPDDHLGGWPWQHAC